MKTPSRLRSIWLSSLILSGGSVVLAQTSGSDPSKGSFSLPQGRPQSEVRWISTMVNENPFLAPSPLPFAAPDFRAIKVEHYMPAFEAGMKQQLEEAVAIANQTDEPTFENTLVALEKSGDILRRVQAVFFNLSNSNTSEEIQAIEEKVAPALASHADNIQLHPKLFGRIQTLWNKRDNLKLSEEQQRLLKETYESFVRAGAKLNAEQQKRIRAINEELSVLTTQFQNNLLAITKESSVVVDTKEELQGLSSAEIAAAAEGAKERGLQGKYLLGDHQHHTSAGPDFAQQSFASQAGLGSLGQSRLGRNGNIDNQPLVLKIAKLRAERAKLLGYENHAAYSLENQMAARPEAAFKMLRELVPQVVAKVAEESKEIVAAMREDGLNESLKPWDWEYYAEKVRKAKYQVDENLIKPYFELDGVLKNGVFFAYKRLYGIEFRERKDLPTYHPVVRVFDVSMRMGSRSDCSTQTTSNATRSAAVLGWMRLYRSPAC